MRLLVIGIGDCGCRVADAMAQLNRRAWAERRITIVTRAYAINTDRASLAALATTDAEALQPVFVEAGADGYKGGGSEAGAELFRDKIEWLMTVMRAGEFFEADAFLLVAGSAGSLGSGGVPIIAQRLKERYVGKSIYALIMLPFKYEEAEPRCIYNTAVCLKSISQVAAAVFLADNEKFRSGDVTPVPIKGMRMANKGIVEPFYDLLCASELSGSKHAGAIALGVGEIVQTLTDWTVIGDGETRFQASRFSWGRAQDFRDKGSETLKVMEAVNGALGRLSTDCQLEYTGRALYLLSTPAKGANIEMTKAVGKHLQEVTDGAEIRGGDFSGTRDSVRVTLVLSQLTYVEKVREYYDRAISLTRTLEEGEVR